MTAESPDDESWQYLASNEQGTERLGSALAEKLCAGMVVALVGDLGAGKTRLVQSIAAAMGVPRVDVNSPTFVLIQEYEGRLPLFHIDTYRLRDTDEFLELGTDELIEDEGVCLIEWADRVIDVLPKDLLRIEIECTGETSRRFQLTGSGPRSNRLVCELKAADPA